MTSGNAAAFVCVCVFYCSVCAGRCVGCNWFYGYMSPQPFSQASMWRMVTCADLPTPVSPHTHSVFCKNMILLCVLNLREVCSWSLHPLSQMLHLLRFPLLSRFSGFVSGSVQHVGCKVTAFKMNQRTEAACLKVCHFKNNHRVLESEWLAEFGVSSISPLLILIILIAWHADHSHSSSQWHDRRLTLLSSRQA